MILIGPSNDGLWRVGRGTEILHTCKPEQGYDHALASAGFFRRRGEQVRRHFWRVGPGAPLPDLARTVKAKPEAVADPIPPAVAAADDITDDHLAALLAGRVADIEDAIHTGIYDDALDRIEAAEQAAAKPRKGVARALRTRREDIEAEA